jgi:hypothetical protein
VNTVETAAGLVRELMDGRGVEAAELMLGLAEVLEFDAESLGTGSGNKVVWEAQALQLRAVAGYGQRGVCNRCGELGHGDQVVLLPVDAEVVAVSEFGDAADGSRVTPGMVGRVFAHCDDGRAMVSFGDKPSHTFHQPGHYVARVRRNGEVAADANA